VVEIVLGGESSIVKSSLSARGSGEERDSCDED
jgi:hypothetical protein